MTGPDPMQAMHDQNDYLRKQLHALDGKPKAIRRKFLLLVVLCGRCQDVLAEIVDLDPYPVLRHWPGQDHPETAPFEGGSPAERLAHRRAIGEPIRRGESMFHPLPSPLPPTGDPETVMHTVCKCYQWALSDQSLFAWAHAPKRTKVLHPPTHVADPIYAPLR